MLCIVVCDSNLARADEERTTVRVYNMSTGIYTNNTCTTRVHVKQVQAYLEDQAQLQDQETRLSARSRMRRYDI